MSVRLSEAGWHPLAVLIITTFHTAMPQAIITAFISRTPLYTVVLERTDTRLQAEFSSEGITIP